MTGTVRYSEVYGRTAQAARPKPPAVNVASGPPDGNVRPATMFLGLIGLLIIVRLIWEQGE